MLKTAVLAVLSGLALAAPPQSVSPSKPAPPPEVLVAAYSGVINPSAAEYLAGAVAAAERRGCGALVIELDTPGGLDLSMRDIVKAILASAVPVIVYVAPAGARAASAGVFITMAAHVAAMAPGTNIGAAHPVQLGTMPAMPGKEKGAQMKDDVMEGKMVNDSAAYLQAIAGRRGRNIEWAFQGVTKSTSIVSSAAVRERVVDLEAKSLDELLAAVDGKELADFKGHPLRTKGAKTVRFEMTGRQKVLAAVADPNIAMILMTLGVSGLLIELYSPGLILPGIVGVVSLIMAFYSFQTLSASFAGVLLIMLGFLLYVLELKVHSYGLLAVTATASILFGTLMLFRNSGGGVAVSMSIIVSTLGTLVALVASLLFIATQAFRKRSKSGAEGMIGRLGVAQTALDPAGTVALGGELWKAESLEGNIPAGTAVKVEDEEGLTLRVRRKA
ncbi:MAG: nodulation protein NfeD [Elusimicrobia bacterium]|nr:nodulation protein NfeD [Elusimicrobiota bacterium]